MKWRIVTSTSSVRPRSTDIRISLQCKDGWLADWREVSYTWAFEGFGSGIDEAVEKGKQEMHEWIAHYEKHTKKEVLCQYC